MTSYKLYNTLLLSLSLTLTGCGSDKDTTSETTTPEGTLSLANPIADMTLIADTALNFSIPENTCVHTTGDNINYSMSLANNVGFKLTNFTQLTGLPDALGDVTVTVTCSTDSATFTNEFTITVEDFEADPVVEINTPAIAKHDELLTVTAVAEDVNLSGSIALYSWKVTSEATIVLSGEDTSTVTFTVPDTPEQTTATLEVTVTDNDGSTAIDTVEIDLISSNAPYVSLSFPLALGVYNEDKIDMFGDAGFRDPHNPATVAVTVTVNDIPQTVDYTDEKWRVEDVTIVENADIKVVATSSDGFINYEEITLLNNTTYTTTIDENISDIAVSESTGDIYVHSDGEFVSDLHITKFNLDTLANEELSYTKDATYGNDVRSSIATDSQNLYLSGGAAITKIDLSTNVETILSDENRGTDTNGSSVPVAILDLGYNASRDELYTIDVNKLAINTVDKTTGDRYEEFETELEAVSVVIASNGFTYYSQGQNTTGAALIHALTSHVSYFEVIHTIDTPANGANGGPISDLTLNEAASELYFVDGSGDLVKLNLDVVPANVTATTVLEDLFTVESIVDFTNPLIGLHYDTTRNVIIAAGRDADGTNKLLVIDPVSGDYAKVATGTVD